MNVMSGKSVKPHSYICKIRYKPEALGFNGTWQIVNTEYWI